MSNADKMMPLLTAPWVGRSGEQLLTNPLPALGHEAITNLATQWTGILNPEMRQQRQGPGSEPYGTDGQQELRSKLIAYVRGAIAPLISSLGSPGPKCATHKPSRA
jgi:hypothetical protein